MFGRSLVFARPASSVGSSTVLRWSAPTATIRPVWAASTTGAAASASSVNRGGAQRFFAAVSIGSAAPPGARRTIKGKIQRAQKGTLAVDKQLPLFRQLPPHSYGLMSLEPGRIRGASIEALRRLLTRALRKSQSVLSMSTRCNIPVTKKPLQSRMGKGKGPIDHWIARIAAGSVLFFFQTNLTPKHALTVCTKAQSVIRVKTRIVYGTTTDKIGDSA